jgi:tRNA A58 N-methylase Trm61
MADNKVKKALKDSSLLTAVYNNIEELKKSIKNLPSNYIKGNISGTVPKILKDAKKIKQKKLRSKSRLSQRTGNQYKGKYSAKG